MYRIELDALNAMVKQNESIIKQNDRMITLLEQLTQQTTDEKPIIDKPLKRNYTRRQAR